MRRITLFPSRSRRASPAAQQVGVAEAAGEPVGGRGIRSKPVHGPKTRQDRDRQPRNAAQQHHPGCPGPKPAFQQHRHGGQAQASGGHQQQPDLGHVRNRAPEHPDENVEGNCNQKGKQRPAGSPGIRPGARQPPCEQKKDCPRHHHHGQQFRQGGGSTCRQQHQRNCECRRSQRCAGETLRKKRIILQSFMQLSTLTPSGWVR